jgi:hypothetical protein
MRGCLMPTDTNHVSINLRWYPPGQCGPNECDLMRAMMDLVNLYKADTRTDADDGEIRRAVNWLNAKYGAEID